MAEKRFRGVNEEGLRTFIESVLDSDNEFSDLSDDESVSEVLVNLVLKLAKAVMIMTTHQALLREYVMRRRKNRVTGIGQKLKITQLYIHSTKIVEFVKMY